MAAWESIKLMSGDGGGAFNVNSAHPFENPTPLSNVVEIRCHHAGTLRTTSATFVTLIIGATLLIVGLEYLPALALGPVADALL